VIVIHRNALPGFQFRLELSLAEEAAQCRKAIGFAPGLAKQTELPESSCVDMSI
jgi:hypothetical protein